MVVVGLVCATEALLCEGVGSGGRAEAEVEVYAPEEPRGRGLGRMSRECRDGLCDDRDSFATDGYVK